MSTNYIYEDNLCLIKTNKYKSINIYLNFAKQYDLKTKLILNLLGRFVGEYSKTYPSKESMTKARDMLYGAGLGAQTKAKNNLLFFIVKYTFINPKFLKDISIQDYLDFFKECLNNVYFSEELLDEFKRNYKDSINRRLDKPINYASNRVIQILSKEEKDLEIYDVDHINEIDSITLDEVKEVYEQLYKSFSLDVCVVGDYDETLVNYLKTLKTNVKTKLKNEKVILNDLNEIIEEKDISQSCLIMMYNSPINRIDERFYAYITGNMFFGIVPTSLLFDEIREKRSLCYHISVTDYNNEGIVKIYTLFDKKNKDIIVEEVNKQINKVINKDYDPSRLEVAKSLFLSSIHGLVDDVDAYTDFLYVNKQNGINISLEEYEERVKQVSVDDIAEIFKNYKHVLTYTLMGTKNEEKL